MVAAFEGVVVGWSEWRFSGRGVFVVERTVAVGVGAGEERGVR